MSSAPARLSGTLAHYRIVDAVGAGGMGEVYRAWDQHLERDVAIKILPPRLPAEPKDRRRLRREALALSKLNHPHIETVHDFASEGDVDFLVMEFIPGETVGDRLRRGPLSESEALQLGVQLTDAVTAAHAQGVVHRDLKPDNLKLTTDGRLKVLDFGLAQLLEAPDPDAPTATVTEAAAGTLPYMAPEQMRGKKADARTDVWGVGCVLYEMATGKRAFPQAGPVVVEGVLHGEPVRPTDANAPISSGLEAVILRCLQKDPALRYQAAADLLADLRGLAGLAAPAAAASSRRMRPWLRNGLVGAAVAGLLGVGGVALWVARGGEGEKPAAGGRTEPITALVVLPFDAGAGNQTRQEFADGIRDELANALSRVSSLKVSSRTSSMRYRNTQARIPEIARELDVDAAVEFSAQWAGDEVIVRASLIDARSDSPLWSGAYRRPLVDMLNLQNDIALAVARQIKAAITPDELRRLTARRPTDPEVYQLCLRGAQHLARQTEADFQTALQLYAQAREKDPEWAPAWAGTAAAYLQLGMWFSSRASREYRSQASRAIETAVALDPDLSDVQIMLGAVRAYFEWNWEGADEAFARGVALNPTTTMPRLFYTNYLTWMGRFQESIETGERTLELDPFEPSAYVELAFAYFVAGREREMKPIIERALALSPKDPFVLLGATHLFRVDPTRSRVAVDLLEGLLPPDRHAWLAEVLVQLGQRERAVGLVRRTAAIAERSYVPPTTLARGLLAIGETDKALDFLERAYEERDPGLISLKVLPWFDPIRSEPRFVALREKMHFPSDP